MRTKLFILLFVSVFSYSQDSTNVAYNKLQEFSRFVDYKPIADTIIFQFSSELKIKDSIILIKDLKIENYKLIVKDLKEANNTNALIIVKNEGLLEISDVKFKQQRNKKWSYLGGGALVGILLGLFLSK